MKRILASLIAIFLLMIACSVSAEPLPSDYRIVVLQDLGILFPISNEMTEFESSGTITDAGEKFYGFSSPDDQLYLKFYGSNLKDLSEAEAWFNENISDQLTKYDLTLNGMDSIAYHYQFTDDNGTVTHVNVVFIENEDKRIVEFWEETTDEERSGNFFSNICPISMLGGAQTNDNPDNEAPAEETEDSAAAETNSASGVCTANQVNLRTEPKSNARSVGQINKGEQLEILETEGEWSKVKCSKGEGYIKTQYIEMK